MGIVDWIQGKYNKKDKANKRESKNSGSREVVSMSFKKSFGEEPFMTVSCKNKNVTFDNMVEFASDFIKTHPDSFRNMKVCVEATSVNGETMATSIDNLKWWSPQDEKHARYAKLRVNGSETKLKIPTEISERYQGEEYLEKAMEFAKAHVLDVYHKNFPKGTPISINVEMEDSFGRNYGMAAQVIAGVTELDASHANEQDGM